MSKLNKKGQSLIIFIIFLPVILMSFALTIDVGLMYHAKIKGSSLLESAKKENLDIEDYFKINGIDILSMERSRNDNGSCVIINYKIESVFGSLLGYNEYDIEVTDC